MKKYMAVALASILLLMFGCSSAGSNYFPMSIGDYWVYRTNFGPKLIVKVVRKEKVKDYDTYAIESYVDVEGEEMPVRSNEDYYAKTDQGILKVKRVVTSDKAEIYFDPPETFLRETLIPGKKWQWKGKQGNVEAEFTCEVAGREKVHLMGRDFDCIKVMREGSPVDRKELKYQIIRWYAPGIGIIREVSVENGLAPDETIKTVTSVFELMDYRVR